MADTIQNLSIRSLPLIVTIIALTACSQPAAAPSPAPQASANSTQIASPTNSVATAGQPGSTTIVQSPSPVPTTTSMPEPTPLPELLSYVVYQKADGSIWRSGEAGGAPILLLQDADPEQVLPHAIAPDGQVIAFIASVGIWGEPSEQDPMLALWLADGDGSNVRMVRDLLPPSGVDLTPGGEDAFDLLPALTWDQKLAWNTDGTKLAFVSAHEEQIDLYTTTRDGTLERLSNTPEIELGPQWSPEDTLVAYLFASGLGTGAGWSNAGLGVVPASGGSPIYTLVNAALAGDRKASYITHLTWIDQESVVAHLESMPVGGSEVRAINVITSKGTTIAAREQGGFESVAWSKTAQTLALSSAQGVAVWRPGDTETTTINPDPARVLAWSPQGDALAYSIDREAANPGVYIWSLGNEGDIDQITTTTEWNLRWSPNGNLLAIGDTIYVVGSDMQTKLPGETVSLAEWQAGGLFFYSKPEKTSETSELWIWDGTQARKLDQGI